MTNMNEQFTNQSGNNVTTTPQSVRRLNMELRYRDEKINRNNGEFYPIEERSGYNFGKSILKMIESLNMNGQFKNGFLRGLNKCIFRELKYMENKGNKKISPYRESKKLYPEAETDLLINGG